MPAVDGDPAGAAPSAQEEWLAIDWQAAHLNVRRLQVRIVKATQAGRWGRVRALQRLLSLALRDLPVTMIVPLCAIALDVVHCWENRPRDST